MKRLYSIDLLRGMALAGMILVNNPGDWGNIYSPFEHVEFCGLRLADLVFPTFMFVMGFCIPLSFRRYGSMLTKPAAWHILKRTLTIFAIGLMLQWMSSDWCEWSHLRIPGVLQRLAVCYGIASLIYLSMKRSGVIISLAVVILAGYELLLHCFQGYEWSEVNIISRVDHYLLGANHLYVDNGIRLDPEGILSTIPSIAHVLIGVCLAQKYLSVMSDETLDDDTTRRKKYMQTLVKTAVVFLAISTPCIHLIVKKVWSASFVLMTIAIAAIVLSSLIYFVDIKKLQGWWSEFFVIFGRQPLVMYVVAWILADWFGQWGITWNIYNWFCNFCTPCLASLLYAILFVIINWGIAFALTKAQRCVK